LHVTVQNLLNHPVFSTPGFLGESNITSQSFGQTTDPVNNNTPRNVYLRLEFKF
jgi:hypothetical protein